MGFAPFKSGVMSNNTAPTSNAFADSQKSGFMMLVGMAATLVVFAIFVATSLPVSQGIKLSAMDADEVAAQMATE